MRKSAMLMIECLEDKLQLAVELIGRRGDKFVDQIVKTIRLHYEVRVAEFFSKLVDHVRKVFRAGQIPQFFEWPHCAMIPACTTDSVNGEAGAARR